MIVTMESLAEALAPFVAELRKQCKVTAPMYVCGLEVTLTNHTGTGHFRVSFNIYPTNVEGENELTYP